MKIKLRKTDRGFLAGEFQDLYGVPCSIQESSLAGPGAIWLGRDNRKRARMHLNQELVAALLPLLKRFVKTGELES